MAQVSKEQIEKALEAVRLPGSDGNIVALGLVSEIFIADAKAYFSITVPAEKADDMEPLRLEAERVVKSLPGIQGAIVALTADRKAGAATPVAKPRPAPPAMQPTGHQRPAKAGVPGIGAIIAVASGKGGVGKSTTAVNLALGLKANGLRVGILDADIYGPSLPRLLKISGRPRQLEGRILEPMENYGLKVMSIGFLVDEDAAMIWRGPMVQSAILQMLREVPLTISIREMSDAGTPVVVAEPDGPQALIYREIAAKVWTEVTGSTQKPVPTIIFE